MKNETVKYLIKDLISLHQILIKLNNTLFSTYRCNITKHVTISSIAIFIYCSNFLNPETTHLTITSGKLENAIRASNFGGRCEIFKPIGENLNYYDFNSLYPSAMLQPLPIGNPVYTLNKNLDHIFGYVYAKITTNNLNNLLYLFVFFVMVVKKNDFS